MREKITLKVPHPDVFWNDLAGMVFKIFVSFLSELNETETKLFSRHEYDSQSYWISKYLGLFIQLWLLPYECDTHWTH